MQFAEILTQLMREKNVTAYRIGKDTGISNRLITYWKDGEKMPGAENLKKLANYFCVSVDYLLGKAEDGVNLNQILGVVAEAYGISWEESTAIHQILQRSEWREKRKGLGLMDSFALYFGEQKEKPATSKGDELTDMEKIFISLPPERRQEVLRYMEYLVSLEGKQK